MPANARSHAVLTTESKVTIRGQTTIPAPVREGVETPNYKKEAIRAGAYGLQGWLFPGCYFDNLDV